MSRSPSTARAEQIQRLFDETADLDADERAAFLDQLCLNAVVRQEVESLLTAHDHRAGNVRRVLEHLFLARQPTAKAPGKGIDTDPLIGQTLARYQIVEKLGGGGMGVVYKAHDTRLDRTVALKFLPPHLGFDEEAKQRFIHEAKAASALDHANICTVYDIDETDDGRLFIAMAFYAGETLKKKIARGPLPVEEALDYAMQVAEGLSRAHEAGIVHRDVKPANVMVTEPGQVKIVDFGLAKVQDVSLTQTGTTLGTVSYMSPEQALGETVDHRTDLWSLGVVLYEMLTGERPFGGDYAAAILYAIRHDEPEPVRVLRSEVPEALAQVVEKLLKKEPDERYGQAEQVLADLPSLQRTLEAGPPEAGAVSVASPRLPRVWRYGGVAVLGLVLIGLGVLLWRQMFLPETSTTVADAEVVPTTSVPSLAVLPLKNYTEVLDEGVFADGMTEELITTLTKIEGLRTISHRSVLRFKDTVDPMPVIADSLGVGYIVDASVRQAEGNVWITANLYEGPTEAHLWGKSFERQYRDVLFLQREVALAIAQEIKIALTAQDMARLETIHPIDPEAHRLYRLGRHLRFLETKESVAQAIEKFEQAIAIDSTFAEAYAGLSRAYLMSFIYLEKGQSQEEGEAKAIWAAERAMQLNPNLSEAQAAFTLVEAMEWDWEGAEQSLRRAITLNPGNWDAHRELGWILLRTGRLQEGLEEMQRLLDLDPLAMLTYRDIAHAYQFNGQYDKAIALFGKALEIDPNCCSYGLGWTYWQKGMSEEAIAVFKAWGCLGCLGHAYGVMGRQKEALQILDDVSKREQDPTNVFSAGSEAMAMIYAGLGDTDRALDFLEQAVEEQTILTNVKIQPFYASLHAEPRFKALLKKMGLE